MAKVKSDAQVAALLRKAVELHQQNQLAAAQAAYVKYLKLAPRDGDTMGLLAVVKFQQGFRDGALDLMKRALALAPNVAGLRFNYAKMLVETRNYDEAKKVIDGILGGNPTFDPAVGLLGTVLMELGRPAEAAEAFRSAAALAPQQAHYAFNLAMALSKLYQFEGAENALRQAARLNPSDIETRFELARRLYGNAKHAEAAEHFKALLEHDPHNMDVLANLILSKLRLADWDGFEELSARFRAGLDQADGTSRAKSPSPYVATLISDDAADCFKAARARSTLNARQVSPAKRGSAGSATEKIRVGYVSADYRAHATSYLICELIELHDRSRFEIVGISYGPDDKSPMRQRISSAFDRFVDVADRSSAQMVGAMRDLRLDIAVDLQGFNQFNRMDVFAARPAPIQVLYLGWPGTSGAPFYDYVLADPIVAPRENFAHFSEAVVWLPGSYQANDRRREISGVVPSRADCGLPAEAFVFACFNNVFKIVPDTFAAWMRILGAVPASVLWLIASTDAATNLRQRAASSGIDPQRLIFAPTLPNADHLARLPHVDLVLDTAPYNAHTTASDALWQRVPVLTRTGRTFASRVATSLLHACQLPELAVDGAAEYERRAIELATNPALLGAIRTKLAGVRETSTLFDTPALARHIERAFIEMKLRHDRRERASPIALR